MPQGVLISVNYQDQPPRLTVFIMRDITIREAQSLYNDIVTMPKYLLEYGDVKKVIGCAATLHSPLYAFNDEDAEEILSVIETMQPSHFESI
ncbi:hypothetical protein EDD15DRAFT_2370893 [Pisolithus albus]|nr:hypothetical protein EDD15DRAFT_2370893 [Pisolithus albus]